MSERWIVIPNWRDFQHYQNRDPAWIKNYRRLLHDDDYRRLTATQRATLHGLWLEYAASDGKVRESTSAISQQLGLRVTKGTLVSLKKAGFIRFSASKPLALRYQAASPEVEREIDRDTTTAVARGADAE